MSLVTDIGQQIMNRWTVSSGLPDGLLDLYPGAAAGYSLRRLRKAQTQGLVLRRDNDDATTDIGFLSNGDLDAQSIIDFCGGANGHVRTWYDQSGNTNDLVQTTLSAQPQIYNGSAVLTDANGNYAILSDDSDDIFSVTDTIIGTTQRTEFLFMAYGSAAGGAQNVSGNSTTGADGTRWINQFNSSLGVSVRTGSTSHSTTPNSVLVNDQASVITSILSGTTQNDIDVWINSSAQSLTVVGGTTIINTASGNYQVPFSATQGGSYSTEIIRYPTAKTTDRAAIEADILAYWNIT
jgi:hypothetical protein